MLDKDNLWSAEQVDVEMNEWPLNYFMSSIAI